MKKNKKFLINIAISIVVIVVVVFLTNNTLAENEKKESSETVEVYQVRLFFFGTPTCPHCQDEKFFLEKIKEKYSNLEIQYFDATGFRGKNLFNQVVEEYNLKGGVPTNIIGNEVIVGFDNERNIGKKIEDRIKECSLSACNSKLDEMAGLPPVGQISINKEIAGELLNLEIEEKKDNQNHIHNEETKVSVFGKEICAEDFSSTCFLGVVLGLADGINPCMFSVLFFILSYLLAIGSRKKAFKAGIAFIATTFVVYFLFMYGILRIIDFLDFANQARVVISIFAFIVGLIMIKDFFFYGRFVSLEIPKFIKPTLEKLVKKGTIPSAILLAILAGIVELPCTSGLPLAYISVLSKTDVSSFWYIALYNLFFVLPLIVIVTAVIFFEKKTEELEGWRKSSRKYMRLIAGILLIFLAVALWKNWF